MNRTAAVFPEQREFCMIPLLRQQSIVKHITEAKVIGIDALAEMLGVSSMTVRRDVEALEQAGYMISLSRGMAILKNTSDTPLRFFYREISRPEMDAIARVAEPLIGEGTTIYLDSGPTILALARQLCEKRGNDSDLLIVTSDLAVSVYLIQNSNLRIYHTGGMVSRETNSCSGIGAAKVLRSFSIDTSFLTTPSWDTRWLSTLDSEKSPLKKAAVTASRRCVLLSDSSKFGKLHAFKSLPMSSIDVIVTDNGLPKSAVESFEKQGIELVLVARK